MGPDWKITESDIHKTRNFIQSMKSREYVKKRICMNVSLPAPEVTHDLIWEGMFDCLLSTRQKSGPGSPIAKFLCRNPFPLPYATCVQHENTAEYISSKLGAEKGVQYKNKIGKFAEKNLDWLENGGWEEVDKWITVLQKQRGENPLPEHQKAEREIARNFSDAFLGIGPKQSRNYLQLLGLIRYEIPLDSRFVSWFLLNEFPILFDGKPIRSVDHKIIIQRLSVPYLYEGILDRVQELCFRCGILPVVLDACVFASFDPEWEGEKIPF